MASGERFGYEWERYNEIIPEHETQFIRWVAPLQAADFAGKTILDVGCGNGRNLNWPLRYGAARAVGIDVDDRTLEAARKNLSSFPQADIRRCSAYDLTDENLYDIAFSIGVIHHLERPQEAVNNMARAAKHGGKVLLWVYGYEGNELLVPLVNTFRKILVPLPPVVSNALSYILTAPLWLWLKIVPQSKPYWKLLSGFSFTHVRGIVLDQLLPKVANYWKREEAMKLLQDAGLTDVIATRVNGMSWTVIGTKA
jgi:SAM-dependent methyltransferase